MKINEIKFIDWTDIIRNDAIEEKIIVKQEEMIMTINALVRENDRKENRSTHAET